MKSYTGNCHCGAVKFRIHVPEIETVKVCNCSICYEKGYCFVDPNPKEKEDFELLQGEDMLESYAFGDKGILHKFCRTCGTPMLAAWAKGDDPPGVMARTIPDVDVWALKIDKIDQSKREPQYQTPPAPKHDLVAEEGEKIYTGSCHCGAVKVAVRTKPLPEVPVRECNCSICMRHGRILCYPTLSQVQIFGEENRGAYQYGFNKNYFCKTCGVPTDIEIMKRPAELTKDWKPETLAFFEKATLMHPVNVRILSGVEWEGEAGESGNAAGTVKVEKVYGKEFPHPLDENQEQ